MAANADKDWWETALQVLRSGGTILQAAQASGRSVSVVSLRRQRARREGVYAGPVDGRSRRTREGSRSERAYWLYVRDGLGWTAVAERLGYTGPNANRVVAGMAAHWALRRGLPRPADAVAAKAA